MNNVEKQQIVDGTVAAVSAALAEAEPYATSGTPNLDKLVLKQVALADDELASIIAEVRQAVAVDEGRKAIFDAVVGLAITLLKSGIVFLKA